MEVANDGEIDIYAPRLPDTAETNDRYLYVRDETKEPEKNAYSILNEQIVENNWKRRGIFTLFRDDDTIVV